MDGLYVRSPRPIVAIPCTGSHTVDTWISVKLTGNDRLLIGCVYKSPNSDGDNIAALNTLFQDIVKTNGQFSHILIMGDFNYPNIDWNSWTCGGDRVSEALSKV